MAKDPAQRKEALQELEHYFLYMLLEEMDKSVPESELFGNGQSQQVWKDMLNDALAGAMTKSGQFGLAQEMERQMALQDQAFAPGQLPKDLAVRPLHDTRPRRVLPVMVDEPAGAKRIDFSV
jgi:Rod binding domain-containing protein